MRCSREDPARGKGLRIDGTQAREEARAAGRTLVEGHERNRAD